MREIKFRAYEFDAKHMHYFTLWDLFLHKSILPALEASSEIMLSTGLKDMNGVEIYEGDILNWMNFIHLVQDFLPLRPESLNIKSIGYFDAEGKFQSQVCYPDTSRWIKLTAAIKVIGNKYENPEFLKKVK